MIKIKVGDFVVDVGRYGNEVAQAKKVSDHCYWAVGYDGKDRRRDGRDVVYSGDEKTAKKLSYQLTSSLALQNQERQRAGERRIKRDQEYIAAASANRPVPGQIKSDKESSHG